MSLIITSQSLDYRSKVELAIYLSNNASFCNKILNKIFQDAIEDIENQIYTDLDFNLKNKIWKKISKDRLLDLKEEFLFSYSTYILKRFDALEIQKILIECKQEKKIQNPIYFFQIQKAYHFSEIKISNRVIELAKFMIKDIILDIKKELENEGISF